MITRTRSNESRASSSSRRDWGVISIGLAFAETMRIIPTTTEKRSLILSTVFIDTFNCIQRRHHGQPHFPENHWSSDTMVPACTCRAKGGNRRSWFRGRTTAIVTSPSWHDLACLLFSSDGHTSDLAYFPRRGEKPGPSATRDGDSLWHPPQPELKRNCLCSPC